MELRLKSAAFSNGGPIPRLHTCDGRNLSPPLFWSGVPDGTKSLCLMVDDPDAPRRIFLHWLVTDLPPSLLQLSEGIKPRVEMEGGGFQGRNDFGDIGYGGPCPPAGTHNYAFTLYALSEPLGLSERATRDDFLKAIGGKTLGQARLVGRYSRSRGTIV
jgi:Raf kinase inhibitor-like YbhB/YbcL family protein